MSAPRSIGVIMDGNRRWAKERNLPTLEGHKKGFERIRDLISWCQEASVEEVVLYAFSTENWKRSPEEVTYLMDMFEHSFANTLAEIAEKGIRVRFMGQLDRFSVGLQQKMQKLQAESSKGTAGTLTVALSYGGRPEILAAVNTLLQEGRDAVNEEEFSNALWSTGLLDPDLILRTGGERRLSNFLPWQSVYSELFFTDTKWPEFSREEFNAVLAEYAERERRHGK